AGSSRRPRHRNADPPRRPRRVTAGWRASAAPALAHAARRRRGSAVRPRLPRLRPGPAGRPRTGCPRPRRPGRTAPLGRVARAGVRPRLLRAAAVLDRRLRRSAPVVGPRHLGGRAPRPARCSHCSDLAAALVAAVGRGPLGRRRGGPRPPRPRRLPLGPAGLQPDRGAAPVAGGLRRRAAGELRRRPHRHAAGRRGAGRPPCLAQPVHDGGGAQRGRPLGCPVGRGGRRRPGRRRAGLAAAARFVADRGRPGHHRRDHPGRRATRRAGLQRPAPRRPGQPRPGDRAAGRGGRGRGGAASGPGDLAGEQLRHRPVHQRRRRPSDRPRRARDRGADPGRRHRRRPGSVHQQHRDRVGSRRRTGRDLRQAAPGPAGGVRAGAAVLPLLQRGRRPGDRPVRRPGGGRPRRGRRAARRPHLLRGGLRRARAGRRRRRRRDDRRPDQQRHLRLHRRERPAAGHEPAAGGRVRPHGGDRGHQRHLGDRGARRLDLRVLLAVHAGHLRGGHRPAEQHHGGPAAGCGAGGAAHLARCGRAAGGRCPGPPGAEEGGPM
ncbi:MAG: Apolipoprotein N-acyltransferase in lipid-linked oligosaccharide synthesis cluster, partial [uncultured Blastococcus sp.]